MPVTVKINIDYAGRATTNGVVAFKDNIAKEDSAPVANFRKAGAIIFGRTNTPAFSHRAFTDNDLHGRTLNPWYSEADAGRLQWGCVGGNCVWHGADCPWQRPRWFGSVSRLCLRGVWTEAVPGSRP